VSPLLRRASRRHLLRHPGQFGLAVLGIALGVAVTVSIALATQSARRAFALSTEAVTGRATHQVVGGPGGLDEGLYPRLRLELGLRRAAPVLEADVALPSLPGRAFRLLGVDPLAEEPFRPFLAAPAGAGPGRGDPLSVLGPLMTRPGAVLLARPAGQALGLDAGGTLEIRVAGARHRLAVVGWLEPEDAPSRRALEHLLVADIATAQELLGARGRLSRIDLVLADGEAARVAALLPAGAQLVAAGARAEGAARLARTFSLHLTALSLLALLVGMFLIYNTMTFSVVRRRPLIGLLRALGVTRGEVFALVLGEAAVVGVVGTLLGLGLGLELSRGLLRLVTRTINDLYFVLSVREVTLPPATLLQAALLGVGATVAAALPPALEATGARPGAALRRVDLESRARRLARPAAALGLAVLGAGGALLAWPAGGVGGGFLALFAVVLGAALLAPAAVLLLARPLAGCAGAFGLVGRLAAGGVAGALSRTGVATAALMVAVAATVGVDVMVTSFRLAVARWLEGTLQADLYVSPPSLLGNRPDSALDPALAARLAALPGVAATGSSRAVEVPSPRGPIPLVALRLGGPRPAFHFVDGRPPEAWAAFDAGAVLAAEPLAARLGLAAGDRLVLRTDRGERSFPVAGVVQDYGSPAGALFLARAAYEAHWDDRALSGLALHAAPGADLGALRRAVETEAAGVQEVVVRSSRTLREASLAVFDRTFAITRVLRLLIVVVAIVGVVSALMALQLERTRELGVLRALGVTPRQLWALGTVQSGLLGLLAGLLALPLGAGLAALLVGVVNRRSFGWTMPLAVGPAPLLEGLGLAVGAALLAGLLPARRMAAVPPAEALREE
jgi:putative ABC transport system permease protein